MANKVPLILALSFFFTLLFVWSKRFHGFSIDEQPIIGVTATFSSVLFALLLSFTVANFYDDFQDVRSSITKEVLELEMIYEIIADVPDGKPIITSMKAYIDSVITDEWPNSKNGKESPQTVKAHLALKKAIMNYVHTHPDDHLNDQLSSYIAVSDNRHNRLESNKDNNFMTVIVVIAGLLTVVAFWFLKTSSLVVQFIVDFGVIAIVTLSLYLLLSLDQPIRSQELGLSIDEFKTLRDKIAQ